MEHASLHAEIIGGFLRDQRPPTVAELVERFGRTTDDVRGSLRALAEYHGVVLHPRSDEVWVAHPFSAAPTNFVVHAGGKRWWGNCAWCSLGVAHLAGGDAIIETRLGALEEHVTLRIVDGQVLDTGCVVHFPVPMRRAWDNVTYTCSVMLLFNDEAAVDEWCLERGVPKGDVRPVEQVWRFAQEWYGRHADTDWTKWSVKQAAEIFRRHGLTGPIWDQGEEDTRF
ncbi:MAG TPA: alkylmercury lyase family protein [Trueperaceae bacterium]